MKSFMYSVLFLLVGCIPEGVGTDDQNGVLPTNTGTVESVEETGTDVSTVDTGEPAVTTTGTSTTSTTTKGTIGIGDFYAGGVVFYLDDAGFGLIASVVNLGEADWSSLYNVVPDAFDESIGAGETNTNNAVKYLGGPSGSYAVHLCYNATSEGYDDWYLPSKDELWEMMLNKDLIDSVSILNGGEAITSTGFFWSSTQGKEDSRYVYGAYAEMWDMDGNSVGPYAATNSKNESMYVRAIRSFYVE